MRSCSDAGFSSLVFVLDCIFAVRTKMYAGPEREYGSERCDIDFRTGSSSHAKSSEGAKVPSVSMHLDSLPPLEEDGSSHLTFDAEDLVI